MPKITPETPPAPDLAARRPPPRPPVQAGARHRFSQGTVSRQYRHRKVSPVGTAPRIGAACFAERAIVADYRPLRFLYVSSAYASLPDHDAEPAAVAAELAGLRATLDRLAAAT